MINYILDDYRSNKVRAIAEIVGMLIGVGVSVVLAVTTPVPPMVLCYMGWVVSAILLGVSSWHRGSTGLTILYGSFLVIDTIGLLRTLGVL